MLGFLFVAAGSVPIGRFLYYSLTGAGDGHIQSLVLGSTLTIMGTSAWMVGLLADLIAANRQLVETTLEKVRCLEIELARQTRDQPTQPSEALSEDSEHEAWQLLAEQIAASSPIPLATSSSATLLPSSPINQVPT